MKKTSVLFLALTALISFAFITPNEKDPKQITVIIDAGHGGIDFGATSNGTFEKVIVAQIAERIKSLNDNKNVTILFTRASDEFITLDKRTEYINTIKPDLVLSLHVNSSPNHEKSGVDYFVSKESKSFEKSNKIAAELNTKLSQSNNFAPAEIKTANYHILKKSDAPAVLIELGYLSNANDKKFLTDEKEQGKIAKNIVSFLSELK